MDKSKLQAMVSSQWPPESVGGVATSAMLAARGLGGRCVGAAAAQGLVQRLQRGAYIRAADWNAAAPWHKDYLMLIAHVLASHCQGVYSHSSAARIHGLGTWGCGAAVHVSFNYSPGSSGRGSNVVAHRQSLAPEDVALMRIGPLRVPVTSLERTIVDCSRHFTLEQSVIIGDHGLRSGASVQALKGQLAGSPIKRGAARARKALDFFDPNSESAGESRTRVFLAGTGLPLAELQVTISTRHGDYRVDFAWRQYKLILEFDGWGKYFNYRPTPEVLANERQREKDLMELGWQFIRIGWADFKDPVTLESRIRAALVRAGAVLPVSRTRICA
ncbi:hypothetical protein [Arthrobacter sp. H35-D1]|uniref:hypothetical protein n=1 Tax=Arthrobacter sp. H35-D1 TaxID=3046202 RepID=UPI0024BA4EC1|nr:hypothetical protein [Arthrobacter sp. H35-D1]MDJ0315112.1 hypothetical protein [Arthrobacter sp. H35-D1]